MSFTDVTTNMKPTIKEKSAIAEGDGIAKRVVDRGVPVRRYLTLIGLGLALVLIIALVVLAGLIYQNTKVNNTPQSVPSVEEIVAGIEDKVENPVSDDSDPSVDETPSFGETDAPQNDVEANVTYHIWQTGEDIQENIAVSGNEEIITTPDARIVYDYDTGVRVTKPAENESDVCFVTDFNITDSIENLKILWQKEETTRYVANVTDVKYVITDVVVNDTTLSPTASDMCDGSKLVWVKQNNDEVGERMERGCRFAIIRECKDELVRVTKSRRESRRKSRLKSRQTCTRGWWGRRKCNTVYYREYYTVYYTVYYTAYKIETVCRKYWHLICD